MEAGACATRWSYFEAPDTTSTAINCSRLIEARGSCLESDAVSPEAGVAGAPGSPARRAEAEARLALAAALSVRQSAETSEHRSAREARRAADRAAGAAPKDPRPLVVGARAALQIGERGEAKRLADRALKLGAAGATADEARRIAAEAAGRRR